MNTSYPQTPHYHTYLLFTNNYSNEDIFVDSHKTQV